MSSPINPPPDGPIALSRDAEVVKTVLSLGVGEPAGRGAKVQMKYSLSLSEDTDANVVDSSAERPDGRLSFTTGRKKVIAALDLAAQSMRAGERAKIRSTSAYAFGPVGSKRNNIPGGADVFLNVEMLEFDGGEKIKELKDMTPAERFEHAKVCKEEGNALFKEVKYDQAMMQYSQCIRFLANVFYKSDVVAEDNETKESDAETIAQADKQDEEEKGDDTNGAGDTGFEEAEVVDATTAEQDDEDDEDEAGSDEDIEVIDVSTAGQEDPGGTQDADTNGALETEETIDESARTEEGATNGENSAAASNGAASTGAEAESNKTDAETPDEKEIQSLHVTTLNNLSLCLIKMEEYRRAVESASMALRLDTGSSKALYYRGRALEALGEWDRAREDFTAAAKIQPNNVGIRMEIAKLDKKQKVHQTRERKQAAAMFA